MVGLAKEEQEEGCIPKLSLTERLVGFGICTLLGYFIQFISFGAIIGVATGNPGKFALAYSIGNLLSLCGTGFLMGFRAQVKRMLDEERRVSSLVFLGALAATFISALVIKSALLVMVCLVLQVTAYVWYVASYIPFGRSCIKNCLGSLCK
jgi:hypothetical protein